MVVDDPNRFGNRSSSLPSVAVVVRQGRVGDAHGFRATRVEFEGKFLRGPSLRRLGQ
jgi:hypothetical protein